MSAQSHVISSVAGAAQLAWGAGMNTPTPVDEAEFLNALNEDYKRDVLGNYQEVTATLEDLLRKAKADNPRIGGAVWLIVFGAVMLGAGILNAGMDIFWGGSLLVLVCWGAQAAIGRIVKRGSGVVPKELLKELILLRMEVARSKGVGDFEPVSELWAREADLRMEIYQAIRAR